MPEIGLSGLMSGDGKRGVGHRPQATAPILDSTARDIAGAFGTGHHGAHHTRLAGFHAKSSACRCLDMPSQLIQGLVAVLDGAETDRPGALCFGRMQLPQRDYGLAVALLIERN